MEPELRDGMDLAPGQILLTHRPVWQAAGNNYRCIAVWPYGVPCSSVTESPTDGTKCATVFYKDGSEWREGDLNP